MKIRFLLGVCLTNNVYARTSRDKERNDIIYHSKERQTNIGSNGVPHRDKWEQKCFE